MQFGIFLDMGSYVAAEVAGHAGYDVLVLDHEHSPNDFVNAIHSMNAARGTGAECWVRIPGNDQAYAKRILDSGADGIMCPMINTAAEVRQFVSYCRYALLGDSRLCNDYLSAYLVRVPPRGVLPPGS